MRTAYRFAIIGHPVKHSLSPLMHEASFRALGIEAEYRCIDVPPDTLGDRLAACRAEGFNGLNVTVPLKELALPLMDHLDASARLYGAVNTIRLDARGMTGFNTDAEGFLTDLKLGYRLSPLSRTVLILGCGGAGRALATACVREGASDVLLADLDASRVNRLAEEIARLLPDAVARVRPLPADPAAWREPSLSADLVVHCTPLGLHEDDPPALPPDAFRPGQFLYDIVYTSRVTPTMRAAQAAGADTANGTGMLVRQGAAAFTVWTGLTADVAAMHAALESRLYGT